MLIGIVILSLGLTALCGSYTTGEQDERLSVVASFYPVYTATLQVVGESDGVTVECLTQPTTGCVHDHQLTPKERATLEEADLLILNGAGAESFLSAVLPQLSAVTVDTADGLELCEDHHEHEGYTHTVNEHIWMDPTMYAHQITRIQEALCAVDPANAAIYRRNAEQYLTKVAEAADELIAAAQTLPFKKTVLFHESLHYLATAMQLETVGTLSLGEDDALSATEVAEIADCITGQAVLFLYDSQYPQQMTQLAGYAASSAALELNSAVLPIDGVADADTWLDAMHKNAEAIKEAAG